MTWGYSADFCTCPVDKWHEDFPAGSGSCQSPIDIETPKFCPDLKPIRVNYDSATVKSILNNGHSVQVNINPGSTIQGAHLDGEYELIQFHFHWGSRRGQGAEHLIGGKSADAELHFVHARKKCDNPTEHANGLAVLGVRMLECDWRQSSTFKTLTDHFSKLEKCGTEYPCEGLNLTSILPNLDKFYAYQGSLTTPPLSECVCWMVCDEPIYVTTSEMEAFRSLCDSAGNSLSDNYRPVQKLNQRILRTNIQH